MTTPFLHHVMVAIPPGHEEDARRFYVDLLELIEISKPASLGGRGGLWLSSGSIDIHFGVDAAFVPARKAHIALLFPDLDSVVDRLALAGFSLSQIDHELPGYRRCYVADPFGNRVELMQAE